MGRWGKTWVLVVLAGLGSACRGQTLAHRNWAGSGMTVAPWWAGAELYEIDPIDFADSDGDGFGDLRGIADRLDYLEGLGVDALLISSIPLRAGGGAQPFDAVNGTVEDFDRLVQAAAARRMRVLVDLRLRADETPAETLAAGRFWLSRGVAGLRVVADPGAPVSAAVAAERTRDLRRLCLGFAGQRVVLSAGGGGDVAFAVSRHGRGGGDRAPEAAAQVVMETRLLQARSLGELRGAVRTSGGTGAGGPERMLATDADGVARSWNRLGDGIHDREMAKAVAAVLLLSGGSPLVYFGQELGMAGSGEPEPMQWGAVHPFTTGTPWIETGPNASVANVAAEDGVADSVLSWYRRLGELRRGNAALRAGSVEMLGPGRLQDGGAEVLGWVRRAKLGEQEASPVVVLVNLSGHAVVASAGGLGSGGLRVLASTFPVPEPLLGSSVMLPAYGVFVGEARKAAGLETVVLAPRTRKR